MAFVDQAIINVKAGAGGKGCDSHYRDLWMRYPRPDGGNGGNGGDVVFIAERGLQTLLDYRFKKHYQGGRGGHGGSKGKKGRTGDSALLKVPVGTVLWDDDTDLLIRDLSQHGQSIVVAQGGHGGLGNMHRDVSTPPTLGEERNIRLELKLIADVGFVGFPNAGKSTLISSISKVRSKIANYPFTTKQPILGIVKGEGDETDFIVADLPGLIEGAHLGKGLGLQFLKHVERTKILAHIIDMSGSEGRDPLDDYKKINGELSEYSQDLSEKIKVVVANKMDLPESANHLKRFKRKYKEKIFAISAKDKTGLDDLVGHLRATLCRENFLDQSKE
ncbi:MAG: GTPase ObgE [Candidatus Omnitrophica bacterium]|nr:GTPase ObgE [Candidatus Omnitrophota bacterium]